MSTPESEILQKQIKQLDNYKEEELDALSNLCFDLLKGKNDNKISASEQLELIPNLLPIFVKAIKLEQSADELRGRLMTIICNKYLTERLLQQFHKYRHQLMSILTNFSLSSNSYNKYVQLRWRFEVKTASKYNRDRFEPYVILTFHTIRNGKKNKHINIKCTLEDIYHVYSKIHEVIESNNSLQCTKLLRNIKF